MPTGQYVFTVAPNGLTWTGAEALAVSLGGHLASVTTQAEHDFVISVLSARAGLVTTADGAGPWIGLRQAPGSVEPAGGWEWINGEPYGFIAWNAGTAEPNNVTPDENYGHYLDGYGTQGWNDLPNGPGPVLTVRSAIFEFAADAIALQGQAAADYIYAGAPDNLIDGGAGNDWIDGAGGNDTLEGGDGNDKLNGGLGNDGGLLGEAGRDVVYGGDGDDTIDGGLDKDTLNGEAGDDTISGGGTGDHLRGGADNDRLTGGLGGDVLLGGTGLDTFVFTDDTEGRDRIDDWVAVDDQIEIDASAFGGGLVAGALAANRLVIGGAANQAFGQFLFNTANGQLSWDIDGTGAAAAVAIARLLNGGVAVGTLAVGDFDIVA